VCLFGSSTRATAAAMATVPPHHRRLLSGGRGERSSRDLARRRCLGQFFSEQLASVIIIIKNKC